MDKNDQVPKQNSNSFIIREAYLRSGYSYRELSAITGVKYETLASWLMGRRNPPDYAVETILSKIKANPKRRKNAAKEKNNENI